MWISRLTGSQFAPALVEIRNVCPREFVEDFASVGAQPRLHPHPERRVGGERQQVRQEVAGAVHQLDRGLTVFHADVHVKAENQVRARHHLQVFHDGAVAVVGIDLLFAPLREGVGAAGRQAKAVLPLKRDDLLSDAADFVLGFLDILADAGANLDHGLVHLRLHALRQKNLALLDDLGIMCDLGSRARSTLYSSIQY